MITTLLKKSSTINYILVLTLALLLFLVYQINTTSQILTVNIVLHKSGLLIVFLGSILLTDLISKKNQYNKNSIYTLFLFLFLILFFPSVLNNGNLLMANFFVLLAVKNILSMGKPRALTQKIFDASICILIASIFHFWCALYFILIFYSILVNNAKNYKNWLIPFVGVFCLTIILVFFGLLFDVPIVLNFINSITVSYDFLYFSTVYQNIAFSVYITLAIYFFALYIIIIKNKPMISYLPNRKLLIWFLTGFVVFIITNNKSNDCLLYTMAPLAILATDFIEERKLTWQKDTVFFGILFIGFYTFFSQL